MYIFIYSLHLLKRLQEGKTTKIWDVGFVCYTIRRQKSSFFFFFSRRNVNSYLYFFSLNPFHLDECKKTESKKERVKTGEFTETRLPDVLRLHTLPYDAGLYPVISVSPTRTHQGREVGKQKVNLKSSTTRWNLWTKFIPDETYDGVLPLLSFIIPNFVELIGVCYDDLSDSLYDPLVPLFTYHNSYYV